MRTEPYLATNPDQDKVPALGLIRTAGLLTGAAAITVGLIAGLFFDWTVSIMPALAEADDRTFVVVMQETTQTMVTNPVFLLIVMGAPVLTGGAAIAQYRVGAPAAARWTLAAFALYAVALLLTMGVHMPLNNTVVDAGDPDRIADPAALRTEVEGPWVNAHLVRTVSCIAALACLCRALWLRRPVTSSPISAARR